MNEHTTEYPQILLELAEQLESLLTHVGIDKKQAEEISVQATEFVREQWGGQSIYIPKGQILELSVRDDEILNKFHRFHDHVALCREYGITKVRLYQIIRAGVAREVKKRQHQLPL